MARLELAASITGSCRHCRQLQGVKKTGAPKLPTFSAVG